MLGIIVLALLPWVLGFALIDWARDDDGDRDGDRDGGEDDGAIRVRDGEEAQGTGGADLFLAADGTVEGATVRGWGGDDRVELDVDGASVSGGLGDDSVALSGRDATVTGGFGNDDLDLDVEGIEAWGNAGDDALSSSGAGATLHGGVGDDAILSSGEGATLWGGAGDDALSATGDGSLLRGGTGDDVLEARGAGSSLAGGAGADILRGTAILGGPGGHSLAGGAGEDRFEIGVGALADPDATGLEDRGTLLTITDFAPGEDVLVIDPAAATGAGPSLALRSIDLDIPFGSDSTDIVLTYQTGVDGVLQRAAIRVEGARLTFDDIAIAAPDDPQTLTVDDDAPFAVGGDGDDVVRSGDPSDGVVTVVTQGGDDTVDVRGGQPLVYGGDGDDDLTAGGYGGVVDGGDGDDRITDVGSVRTEFVGGDGDDRISFRDRGSQEPNAASGGDGDDLIEVTTELQRTPFTTAAGVWGGAGADTFGVTLEVGDAVLDGSGDHTAEPEVVLQIRDFDPAEDVLLVEAGRDDGSPARPFRGMTLVESPDGRYTDVVLTFEGAEGPNGVDRQSGAIRLWGVTGLSASDITLAFPAAA